MDYFKATCGMTNFKKEEEERKNELRRLGKLFCREGTKTL